jgi:hypothetical protein
MRLQFMPVRKKPLGTKKKTLLGRGISARKGTTAKSRASSKKTLTTKPRRVATRKKTGVSTEARRAALKRTKREELQAKRAAKLQAEREKKTLQRKLRAQKKAVEAFLQRWEREYNRKLKEAERLKAKKKRERMSAAKAAPKAEPEETVASSV